MSRYMILTNQVAVPGSRRTYSAERVALIEVEPGFAGRPAAISERAPGVRRIVGDFGTGVGAMQQAMRVQARLEARAIA